MKSERSPRRHAPTLVAAALAALSFACAASNAYRGGQGFSERGDWDLAVARFTKALKESPKNLKYKIALENAKIQASRDHTEKARKQVQAGNLEKAREEFGIAVAYDPSNKAAADDMANLQKQIDKLAADKRTARELAARRPSDATLPVPLLAPRSPVPIRLSMTERLDKVYQTLGALAGVNVVFDPDIAGGKDKVISANLTGVSFQEALDQIGLVNKKAYRVLDRNTILIFDDTNPQTRQRWDDQVMRTFYLENVDVKDIEAVLRTALGTQAKVGRNDSTNSITVIATLDEVALADRFLRANDKPKGEILVEVEILEVNRTKAKEYGLQLSNYQAGIELQPTGAAGEVSGGLTNLRAIFLSSLNASDWVVQIPSAIFAKFLQDDTMVKILSSPKVRAFEGKKATFNVGTDIPIPQFYPGYANQQTGGNTVGFGGTTSAQYKTVGVNLEIDKTKVTTNDEITMEFKAEFSALGEDKVFGTGATAVNYPTFLTRKLENTLRLTDGVTAVIGGLVQGREARSIKGALGVNSIPLLNKFLGGHTESDQEIEILISLTPHILRAPNVVAEDVEPLYLGLRNNLKIPGVRPLFGPEEVEPEPDAPAAAESPSPAPAASVPAPPSAQSGAPATTPTPSPVASNPQPAVDPASRTAPAAAGATPQPGAVPTPPPAGGPLASRSAWDRTEVRMKVGEVQRVAINLFNAHSLKDVSVTVRADTPAIEFVELSAGQLLSVDGIQVLSERQLEGARASAQFKRATPLAGGTGTVALVAFRATRPGEVTIFVENLSLGSGTTHGPVPLAGAVRVTVTP